MALNDIHEARVVFFDTAAGKGMQTHVHFKETLPASYSDLALRNGIVSWWDAAASGFAAEKDRHTSAIELRTVIVQRVFPTVGPAAQFDQTPPIAGTQAGESYAPGSSALLSLRTAFTGRSRRGRMYLPPPSEASVGADGVISSTVMAAAAGRFQAFLVSAGTNAGGIVVVFSRSLGAGTEITVVKGERRVRSQRRRQLRLPLYA